MYIVKQVQIYWFLFKEEPIYTQRGWGALFLKRCV